MQYTPKFIARLNWAPKNGNANTSCAYARVIRENFYWKYISNKKLNIEIILSIPNMHNEKKTRKNETSSKSLLHFCAFFKFKVCCCVYVHLYSHFHSHALNHRRTQCQFLQQLLTIRFLKKHIYFVNMIIKSCSMSAFAQSTWYLFVALFCMWKSMRLSLSVCVCVSIKSNNGAYSSTKSYNFHTQVLFHYYYSH